MNKRRLQRWCNHYSGMTKEACDAGVRFDSLPNYREPGWLDSCPCFGRGDTCPKAEYPTPEELAANRAAMDKRFADMAKARNAIVAFLGGPWKRGDESARGRIDCPVCKAPLGLGFSRSGYNGHIHAACSTDGCVRWME